VPSWQVTVTLAVMIRTWTPPVTGSTDPPGNRLSTGGRRTEVSRMKAGSSAVAGVPAHACGWPGTSGSGTTGPGARRPVRGRAV
jgi:hypothetical protein